MGICSCRIRTGLFTLLSITAGLVSQISSASIIEAQNAFHFRESLSASPFAHAGDYFGLGVHVRPNPFTNPGEVGNATSVTAYQLGFNGTGSNFEVSYVPSLVPGLTDQYGTTRLYDPNFTGAWTLTVKNDLTDNGEVTVQTNSIEGVEALPFVQSVGLSGAGTDLNVSWTQPASDRVSAYSVAIYDLEQGMVVNFEGLDPRQTSYQVPQKFLSGDELTIGSNYLMIVRAAETADIGGGVEGLIASSQSIFQFTPVTDAIDAFLPSVDPDGFYNFNVAIDTPNEIMFFDPLVAIGYDYLIGAGDPNFASVLLPDVGDSIFDLWLFNGSWFDSGFDLFAGIEFDFLSNIDSLGLSQFRILGIETSASLDPADVTAFITGLSFVDTGMFTGQMRPIVVDVAEPLTLSLFGMLLVAMGWSRSKKTNIAV